MPVPTYYNPNGDQKPYLETELGVRAAIQIIHSFEIDPLVPGDPSTSKHVLTSRLISQSKITTESRLFREWVKAYNIDPKIKKIKTDLMDDID